MSSEKQSSSSDEEKTDEEKNLDEVFPHTAILETIVRIFLKRDYKKLFHLHEAAPDAACVNFGLEFEQKALHATVEVVSGLEKQDLLIVCVWDEYLVVLCKLKSKSDHFVKVIEKMPMQVYFDPNEVTGRLTEGGKLKIRFPVGDW